MGFVAPTPSPFNEERRGTSIERNGDDDDLPGSCDFSLDPPVSGGGGFIPAHTSDDLAPSGSSNYDKGDDLEVGEDVLFAADGSVESEAGVKRSLL